MSTPELKTFQLTLRDNGVLVMAFHSPAGNAMSPQFFKDWLTAIQFASASPQVKVVVQTGSGRFYSTGKDLSDTLYPGFQADMNQDMDVLESLVNHLVDFEKPLIAAVNGPAIGFGVTSLGHYDFVYAVPEATFTVPFMRWGFCAEGCSSVLFPRLLGKQAAHELLLMGSTVDAARFERLGFLEILPASNFLESVVRKADVLATFAVNTVKVTRDLVAVQYRQQLKEVNHTELTAIRKLMMSDQSRQAIQTFVDARRAKQKAKQARL